MSRSSSSYSSALDEFPRGKKKSRRLVAKNAVKRGLKASNYRVSAKAAEALKIHIDQQLRQLADKTEKIMAIANRKTVQVEYLVAASHNLCPSICEAWLMSSAESDLARAPVVRAFQRGLSAKYNISESAKIALHNLASHILAHARATASNIARVEKRETIKLRDVEIAIGYKGTVKRR